MKRERKEEEEEKSLRTSTALKKIGGVDFLGPRENDLWLALNKHKSNFLQLAKIRESSEWLGYP